VVVDGFNGTRVLVHSTVWEASLVLYQVMCEARLVLYQGATIVFGAPRRKHDMIPNEA